MRTWLSHIARWLPSVLMMAAIFVLSSIPAEDMPYLGVFDLMGRKAAHMVGYGMLAVTFWYATGWKKEDRRLSWLLAVLYALTDEIHQSFTPGRHAWWVDVVIFDAFGAFAGLYAASLVLRRRDLPTHTETPD